MDNEVIKNGMEIIEFTQEIQEFELMTVLSIVIMVYVAFNLYFMLEKFKVKDWYMEAITKYLFYLTVCLCFSDLSFFIIRKVLRFAESLINTKFDFSKLKVKVKGD